MRHTPPRWAEAWLCLLLPARDRETVSGDLLEEYRDTVRPARGRLLFNLMAPAVLDPRSGCKVLLGGFLVGLLVWQPQLVKIGMSWESLRDLTLILVSTTSAGTAVATLGGLAGTLITLAQRSRASHSAPG